MKKKQAKSFLKKADTTQFDKYNCGNCTKFGTRWCPFTDTENEPTAETRACEHFDKSYTVLVENTDEAGVSTITQEENLYRHYETPSVKAEQDKGEPFSHACGQCAKFGTPECPYLEKNSKNRSCQAFAFKSPEGEDQIEMQKIDYESLTYDIPGQGPIHPENPSRRDLIEHPFEFKTVHPIPFRVATVKTARLSEHMENALNDYILGFQKLKSSGLVDIKAATYDAGFFEKNKYVTAVGILKQEPEIRVYYRMNADQAPDRVVALVDSTTSQPIDVQLITTNEDAVATLQKMINRAQEQNKTAAKSARLISEAMNEWVNETLEGLKKNPLISE